MACCVRARYAVATSTVTGTPLRDHVEHGRALLGSFDDLAQLLLRRVAADAEADADLLEAVAVLVRQSERSLHVHVALERRLDLRQVHAAGGGDVDERRRQARGERVQQVLGRVGAGVAAEQDRRLAGVDHELVGARRVLLVGCVEVADRGAVVRSVDPPVPRAELELGDRGIGLDCVERPEQLLGVDAVPDDLCGRCHFLRPPFGSFCLFVDRTAAHAAAKYRRPTVF